MRQLIYTKHVRWRMGQRELQPWMIERTLQEPERVIPSFRRRALAQRRFGRQTLEVVFKREGAKTIIMTAYWLEE